MNDNGYAPALTLTCLVPELRVSAPSPALREKGDQLRQKPGLVGEGVVYRPVPRAGQG